MPASEAPKFGTSGLRGLVDQLTDDLVARHVAAFVRACEAGDTVLIGEDLRPSSPAIAATAARAVAAAGAHPVRVGAVPTPALALAAAEAAAGAVMVTGSHIPADRNGLKFYTRGGAEITKADEAAITGAAGADPGPLPAAAAPDAARAAAILEAYAARYVAAFGADALAGMRLGLYQHSTVSRDLMVRVFEGLGAEVTPLGRSESFVPVDTEAVSGATRAALAGWAAEGRFDALVSADGDADRPLLADAAGRVIPGDVLGCLTARLVGARRVVTPVTSNSLLEATGDFDRVARTRIGSPFVIAGIEAALGRDPAARVVGFEANGGFLLGFAADLPGGALAPLLTRDAILPLLGPLVLACREGLSLEALLATLPARHTAADRLQDVDRPRAQALLARLAEDAAARADLLGGPEAALDLTDGVRMTLPGGDVVHLRMSGNAAEMRCYGEAEDAEAAQALVARHLGAVDALLQGEGGAGR